MNVNELLTCLDGLGLRYKLMEHAAGGTIVLLERGGRVIGLYPAPDGPNLLWTNPVLSDQRTARMMFNEDNHWNIGGERVWLSPELEYFVASAGEAVQYTVQQAVDPGAYRWSNAEERSTAEWKQEGTALLYQSEQNIRFRLTKQVRPNEDPLRLTHQDNDNAYDYVGYESTIELSAADDGCLLPLSSWSIVQVPAGGFAYAPTYGHARPTDLFAPTGALHLFVGDGIVRFAMDGKSSHKLSLTSCQTTGRFGYCRQGEDGKYKLIVRQVFVDPSADYLDSPWHDPADTGHCVQLYNDDGAIGAFGELEHHAAAARRDEATGGYVSRDRSQLWCYSGERGIIADIGRKLLGAELLFHNTNSTGRL